VFEPALRPGATLAAALGGLVGTGPGAGMGVMFLFTCVVGTLACLVGYLFPALRNVERDLPDVV
ncbi:MAG: MFS transporter, partial [Anaerolineaceae bacterium]|nr:MFS transporter [Anaerolineaceae bacterium]